MNFIVAVTEDWGIGIKGGLLLSIPEDMQFFRRKTMGAAVVMGQTTLESFPGGKPLRDRRNIVLSDDPNYEVPGATVVHSLEEARDVLRPFDKDKVFVIGGASIYTLFLPFCQYAYITKMAVKMEADRYIPNLDELPEWSVEEESEEREYEGVRFKFLRYANADVQPL